MVFSSRKLFVSVLLAVGSYSTLFAEAAPWPATSKHATHRVREIRRDLQVETFHPDSTYEVRDRSLASIFSAYMPCFDRSDISRLHCNTRRLEKALIILSLNELTPAWRMLQRLLPVAVSTSTATLSPSGRVSLARLLGTHSYSRVTYVTLSLQRVLCLSSHAMLCRKVFRLPMLWLMWPSTMKTRSSLLGPRSFSHVSTGGSSFLFRLVDIHSSQHCPIHTLGRCRRRDQDCRVCHRWQVQRSSHHS